MKTSLNAVLLAALAVPALNLANAADWGPFNAEFPAASGSLVKKHTKGALFTQDAGFAIGGWFKPSEAAAPAAPLAGLEGAGSLCLLDGKLAYCAPDAQVRTDVSLPVGQWTHAAASYDGRRITLYANGRQVAQQALALGFSPSPSANAQLDIAPRAKGGAGFAGRVAGLSVAGEALDAQQVAQLAAARPNEALTVFEAGSPHWPLQTHQMAGQVTPQDAWTLPKSAAAPSAPVARPAYHGPALEKRGVNEWAIRDWSLQAAPAVPDAAASVASSAYAATGWYKATVPGTVLTTLVDRGVYPDPAYGLNNLAIPESLSRQDWWYRTSFTVPDGYKAGQHLFVTFKGINFASQVWVNGKQVGGTRGAFIRGTFDLSRFVNARGANANRSVVLAVKVSPPPHPGIAQEESNAAGVGENGGVMAQDGPTFIATEGWDWIPSIRDRNTGIWQDVVLRATGDVRLGDAHVTTSLTQPDNSAADIGIEIPVTNLAKSATRATVRATITDRAHALTPIVVSKTVQLAPGEQTVCFTPKEFAALKVRHPQLWWPNGYGKPALHDLNVDVLEGATLSDHGHAAFGIRSVTYELSLMDQGGHLHRVEADFDKGRQLGVRITDGSHEAIHPIGHNEWVTGLRPEAVGTAAIRELPATSLTPYLVIKVNGVRIAARGGNWGMDDFMKRVDRARLEPYFRLHRDANVNIIRNWVGQDTEEAFFDLADEYGLMVLNDFWASTQDYNIEPQDIDLFMANAKDVVTRFRNHPSIVAWFGRNEGVPQPELNRKLESLVYAEDGTRWYTGSSNRINLQNSGPYNYQQPETYFTKHAKGFSVEVGVPSLPTLEALKSFIPESERWKGKGAFDGSFSDTLAYHDWHPDGNGTVKPFMEALRVRYGAPASLEDFERKAQLMNYEAHRAIFEGMNAGLWVENSGRMLWMTQPAWPSTMWQILGHDYDTQASYYGVKHAAEPVHVQMNLPDYTVSVINNPTAALENATVTWEAYGVDGARAGGGSNAVSVAGVATSHPIDFGIKPLLAQHGALVVKVALKDSTGKVISDSAYWPSATPAQQQALNALPAAQVEVSATRGRDGAEQQLSIVLHNTSKTPVLNAKLTLLTAAGERVLPVYWSDNYVALMPGESRTVTANIGAGADAGAGAQGPLTLALRGWNVAARSVTIR